MQLKDCFEKALEASRELNCVSASKIDRTLTALADAAEKHTDEILEANREDLARMEPSDPMYDRLLLNRERIAGIAADIRNVASLPSPLGKILSETVRPNGMKITKVSVPFGVIGVIYEARPNVGFDVFSLCLKSGNACILKGGSDARCSNEAIVRVIREVLCAREADHIKHHAPPISLFYHTYRVKSIIKPRFPPGICTIYGVRKVNFTKNRLTTLPLQGTMLIV